MNRFLPLAFLLVVPTQWLVWTLASITTPHPYVIGTLLVLSVLGGGLGFVVGLSRSTEGGFRKRAFCCLFGLLACGGVGGFVHLVLANDDGEIEVVARLPNTTLRFEKLRIVTFNVLHGFPDFDEQEMRFQMTAHEIQQIDADIIILQEAWSTTEHGCLAERLAKDLNMNFAYARANGSRTLIGFEEGAAILTRHPLVKARRVLLRPREPFWENRIALIAAIDLGGETLTVAGVHLSTSIPDAQVEHLLEVLPPAELLLVAGDFNADPLSNAIGRLDRAGYTRLAPSEARESLIHAEPTAVPKDPIDHVFLTPTSTQKWVVEKSICLLTTRRWHRGLRQAISDHDAVIVDLRRR
jgi:endonuclease/exonuclease/phosphatase family metal-dependent hydrolase